VRVKIDQNVTKIAARGNIFKSNGTGIYYRSQPINVTLWQTPSQQRLNCQRDVYSTSIATNLNDKHCFRE